MQLGSSIAALGIAGAIAGAVALAPRPGGPAGTVPATALSAAPAKPTPRPRASASASTTPARVKRVCTVAAIGDSITDTRSHGGKYLAYLEKHCPQSHFDNYGVGGNMVNQMRRRFARDVLGPSKPHYTHLIVFGGVNDLYSDLTAHRTNARIERDLTKMYKAAHEHGMKVVAITVTPWGGFKRYFNQRRQKHTLELNRWIKAEPASGDVDFVVDAYPLLSCGESEKLCRRYAKPFKDGIHFGTEGQKVLGKALYQAVFKSCL
jgi:lysophospholipase L1-like esterase